MPYIRQGLRKLARTEPADAGELNFAITTLIVDYLDSSSVNGPRYRDFNEVMGVLECAKQELYRRMVAPYEDAAKDNNGDVYGSEES